MADVFYVQLAEAYTNGTVEGPRGWITLPHCYQDRSDAERHLERLERGGRVVQVQTYTGEIVDVTEQIATVYRVVSMSELRAEGDAALLEAQEATKHRPEGLPPGAGRLEDDDNG